jgi:peptide/nickel transport system substrate-binding protein
METTWRIREGARWHDGTPFTADDLLFTTRVGRDREVPIFADLGYAYLDDVVAVDERTVTARWARPFIDADTLFTRDFALPMPRHLLEDAYAADRSGFTQLAYWSREFVGSGPYRVRDWQPEEYLLLQANEGYVLGRPHVDEILIKFVSDVNALIANVLAGEIELTLGRGMSLEQAMTVRNDWHDGLAEFRISGGLIVYPQFINPSPAIVGDVEFRRALVHAIDRPAMAESLVGGLTSAAHVFLSPDYPGYDQVESGIVKYEYDPGRAQRMLEGLGLARGADGTFRDASGQRLSLELRVSDGDDLNKKATLVLAENWQRVGVGVEPSVIPPQRASDREYAATFPAFFVNRQKSDLTNMGNFHSSKTPLPENNFTGTNRSRYTSPALDGLIDRYFTTIPRGERLDVVRQILNHITDRVTMPSLFYSEDATIIGNRLGQISARYTNVAWNAHEWEKR